LAMIAEMIYGELEMQGVMPGFGAAMFILSRRYFCLYTLNVNICHFLLLESD
jgi:hypothetical protein